jgi:hypothetical protein
VIPISSNSSRNPIENWPGYAKDINNTGRSYLLGVLFEDFVDLTRDMSEKEMNE